MTDLFRPSLRGYARADGRVAAAVPPAVLVLHLADDTTGHGAARIVVAHPRGALDEAGADAGVASFRAELDYAADLLIETVRGITRVAPARVDEPASEPYPTSDPGLATVHLGPTARALAIVRDELGFDLARLDRDGFVLYVSVAYGAPTLIVVGGGGSGIGTVFGVAWLLERYAGARWFFPGRLGTVLPQRLDGLVLEGVNRIEEPDFRSRSFLGLDRAGFHGDRIELRHWMIRNRLYPPIRMTASEDHTGRPYPLPHLEERFPGSTQALNTLLAPDRIAASGERNGQAQPGWYPDLLLRRRADDADAIDDVAPWRSDGRRDLGFTARVIGLEPAEPGYRTGGVPLDPAFAAAHREAYRNWYVDLSAYVERIVEAASPRAGAYPRFVPRPESPNAWQPCFYVQTEAGGVVFRDDLVRAVAREVEARFAGGAEAVSIAMSDGGRWCQCLPCWRRNGPGEGAWPATYSERVVDFVDRVARALPARYREGADARVLVFHAHAGYLAPPRTAMLRAFANVPIEALIVPLYFADDASGYGAVPAGGSARPAVTLPLLVMPYVTSVRDEDEYEPGAAAGPDRRNLERWSVVAARLGLYEYLYGGGYLLPRIYSRRLQAALRHAFDRGARGFVAEADPNWGLDGPKLWVTARLLWNRNEDVAALRRDFSHGLAGPVAGEALARVFEAAEELWAQGPGMPPGSGFRRPSRAEPFRGRAQVRAGTFFGFARREAFQFEMMPPTSAQALASALTAAETGAAARGEPAVLRARLRFFRKAYGLLPKLAEAYAAWRDLRERAGRLAPGDRLGADAVEAALVALEASGSPNRIASVRSWFERYLETEMDMGRPSGMSSDPPDRLVLFYPDLVSYRASQTQADGECGPNAGFGYFFHGLCRIADEIREVLATVRR